MVFKDEKDIGEALRNIRVKKRVSQTELGWALWMPRQHIARFECGTKTLPLGVAVQLAHALGVSLDVLAGLKSAEPDILTGMPQIDRQIFSRVRKMRDEQKAELLELISAMTEKKT